MGEVLKNDNKLIHTQLDGTHHDIDASPLKENLPVESIRRRAHRLHIKAVMATVKLVKKSKK